MPRAYYKRQFLNAEEAGGTAMVEARVDEVHGDDDYAHIDAEFKISDCNRIVDLNFYVSDAEDIENVLLKFRRLQSSLKAFGTALREQIELLRERKGL